MSEIRRWHAARTHSGGNLFVDFDSGDCRAFDPPTTNELRKVLVHWETLERKASIGDTYSVYSTRLEKKCVYF